MEGIQFEEGEYDKRTVRDEKVTFFIRLVLKTGLVRTPQAANLVLIGITIVAVLITVFIFVSHLGSPKLPNIPSEALEGMPGE